MNMERIHQWFVICYRGDDGHFVLLLRLVVATSASSFVALVERNNAMHNAGCTEFLFINLERLVCELAVRVNLGRTL